MRLTAPENQAGRVLFRIREEELLAMELVGGNQILPFGGNQPLGHFFGQCRLGLGVFGLAHRNKAVGIGQFSPALERMSSCTGTSRPYLY